MGFIFRLSLKEIGRHFFESFITILGISFAVAALLAVNIMNNTLESTTIQIVREMGTGETDIWIEETTENSPAAGTIREGLAWDLSQKLLENPSVERIYPDLQLNLTLFSERNNLPAMVSVYGVLFPGDGEVRNHVLIGGSLPKTENQALISQNTAQALGIHGGDSFFLLSNRGKEELIVSGILDPESGTGLMNNGAVLFCPLPWLQEKFGYENKISGLDVVLKPGTDIQRVAEELKKLLPANAGIYTDQLTIAALSDQAGMLKISSFFFSLISVIIALFLIYNTFASRAEKNKRQTGFLRLVGMTASQIVLFFLVQSLFYAFLACLFGTGLGIVFSTGLLTIVSQVFRQQAFGLYLPELSQIIFAYLITLTATLGAGLLPAIKSSRVMPLDVFRPHQETLPKNEKKTISLILGVLLLIWSVVTVFITAERNLTLILLFSSIPLFCLGLVLAVNGGLSRILGGFGKIINKTRIFSLRMAEDSLKRRMKSTIVTVCAISLTIAIVSGFFNMTYSFKRTLSGWLENTDWADLVIFPQTGKVMGQDIIDSLENRNQIEKVLPYRYYFISYEHKNLSDNGFIFQGFDPEVFFDAPTFEILGDSQKVIRNLTTNTKAILINENLSRMIDKNEGEKISLATSRGQQDFIIVGIVRDYSDFFHRMGKMIYGPLETLTFYWDAPGYSILKIELTPNADVNSIRDQLRAGLLGADYLKILTHDEELQEVGASLDRIFSIFYAFNAVFLIIIYISILQAVLVNVLHQIYELAMLRILGCTALQMRLQIIFQTLIMGFIGAITGLIAGIWLSRMMTETTRHFIGNIFFYISGVILAVFFIVTLLIAFLASLYPQRICSKINLSGTLSTIDQL